MGTSQIHQIARDGVLISPNEIQSVGGFKFKDTVFRKEIVHAISISHASGDFWGRFVLTSHRESFLL